MRTCKLQAATEDRFVVQRLVHTLSLKNRMQSSSRREEAVVTPYLQSSGITATFLVEMVLNSLKNCRALAVASTDWMTTLSATMKAPATSMFKIKVCYLARPGHYF